MLYEISIHAPRVGSDEGITIPRMIPSIFQSTLPVWGATLWAPKIFTPGRFQSTLPVWGATMSCSTLTTPSSSFQSTLPVWGATLNCSL